MLSIEHQEAKLLKVYRKFEPKTREKILELLEARAKNLQAKKKNGTRNQRANVGEMMIQSLEDYLRGDYAVVNRHNLRSYFGKPRIDSPHQTRAWLEVLEEELLKCNLSLFCCPSKSIAA